MAENRTLASLLREVLVKNLESTDDVSEARSQGPGAPTPRPAS